MARKLDPRVDDMWWASRERTAAYRGEFPETWIRYVSMSLPGMATKKVPLKILAIAVEGKGLGVDLNKYRPDVNVEMLADLGVNIFDLRMFGPGLWTYGDFRYAVDQTFPVYYPRLMVLKQKGYKIIVGGYGVYNAWLDEESNYTSPLDPNVELMKLYAKNYPCDYYIWDNEVYQIYKNGNPNTIITSVNLTKGLAHTLIQTSKEMEHWPNGYPKIPEHYSANWFLKGYGGEDMKVFMENALIDINNMPFTNWLAWVPTVFSGYYETPKALYDLVITPNGVQENAYLHLRSEPLAPKWQLSWTLKGPWSPNVGIDCSITYGLGSSFDSYKKLRNIPTGVTPPPQPPPDTNYVTQKAFDEHKADATAHRHVHQVVAGTPIAPE